jgi:hypothetical protein
MSVLAASAANIVNIVVVALLRANFYSVVIVGSDACVADLLLLLRALIISICADAAARVFMQLTTSFYCYSLLLYYVHCRRIKLWLNDGKEWAHLKGDELAVIKVTKIDTGAGEVSALCTTAID